MVCPEGALDLVGDETETKMVGVFVCFGDGEVGDVQTVGCGSFREAEERQG